MASLMGYMGYGNIMKLNQKTRTTIAYTMMGLLGILQISVLLIIAGLAYTLTSLVVVFVIMLSLYLFMRHMEKKGLLVVNQKEKDV